MVNYGFIASKLDGTELEFKGDSTVKIPEILSYKYFLPEVINQGERPICVPCSLSTYINWDKNLETGRNDFDNGVNLEEIYSSRPNLDTDGMCFKDALHYLRHNGVEIKNGVYKINRYAKVNSIFQLKQALVANGPCIGGLPVYSNDGQIYNNFWKRGYNSVFQGGHAISIVGYNDEGFIIRNSWGEEFGDNGYVILPYDDFDLLMEIWTVI